MKNSQVKCLPILLIMMICSLSYAQDSFNAGGNNHSGAGGSISTSIGQIKTGTLTDGTNTLSEGVQQPLEILTVGINNKEQEFFMSAFPNPSDKFITLESKSEKISDTKFELTDLNGKVLLLGVMTQQKQNVDVSELTTGIYFLRLTQNNKQQTFKLIKK